MWHARGNRYWSSREAVLPVAGRVRSRNSIRVALICRVECGTTRSDFEAVNPADIATLNFPIRAITNCDRNQG